MKAEKDKDRAGAGSKIVTKGIESEKNLEGGRESAREGIRESKWEDYIKV